MERVRLRHRDEFSASELARLLGWLEDAYSDPAGSWRPEHWDDLGEGPHLTIEDEDGALLAHACIAWVPVLIGEHDLLAGYLEDVATRPDRQGRGLGSAVVREAQLLIEERGDIGVLGTGSQPFYERLGWVRWSGPSSVREPDGSVTPTLRRTPT